MKFTDALKTNIFPPVISTLHKMGLSYERLGNISFFAKSNLLAQAKGLGNFEVDNNHQPQTIYVLLMLSGSFFHLYIEALLALGLKKRGHKVIFIMDDNTLPIHELKKIGNEENWDYQSHKDFVFASKFLNIVGLPYISISDFIQDKGAVNFDNKYEAVVEATLLKQYKVGTITPDLPKLDEKTALVKQAIAISDKVGQVLANLKPDSVIMSHGIYSTWGPAFQVLDEHGIPVLVHGRGKKRHSQVFNWNKTGDSWDVSEEWEKVKGKNLSPDQLAEINEYLSSRISHKNDVFVFNFGSETTDTETIKYLGLEAVKPIYTLFTNVLWDAASAQREIAFSNPVEWVLETIKWFNEHPEKQLIIKIHPAEMIIGTNMPFYDIIISQIKPNKNIRIIQPHEKVNSWSIYNITTLGIVHTTTAGMELPLVNKPCMVVSKTHYRGKGFTLDITSNKEYFAVLDNFDPTAVDYNKNKQEAIKYAYLLFIRYHVPFNMFFEEVSSNIHGYRFNTLQEYMEQPGFNEIIDNIIYRRPIFAK